MAFQTGTATNINDLGNQLVTFATANGWTQNGTTTTQGTGIRFYLSKNNTFLNFRTFNTETPSMNNGTSGCANQTGALLCNLSTGYNGAQNWYNQTGFASYGSGTPQTQTVGLTTIVGSIPAYYFFSFSGTGYDVLYVVIEYTAGIYQYMLMGMLDKSKHGDTAAPVGLFATATGNHTANTRYITSDFFSNTFFDGWNVSPPNCILNATVATAFSGFTYRTSDGFSTNGPSPIDSLKSTQTFSFNIPNSFSTTSPMTPIIVGCYETAGNYWVPIGELPNVFITNIKNNNPAETITISTDNYKIFPFYIKDTSNNVAYPSTGTGTWAFAVKY